MGVIFEQIEAPETRDNKLSREEFVEFYRKRLADHDDTAFGRVIARLHGRLSVTGGGAAADATAAAAIASDAAPPAAGAESDSPVEVDPTALQEAADEIITTCARRLA